MKSHTKHYNLGKQNGVWKGNEVGYEALHDWVKRHLEKPQTCRDCNQPKPLDLANISQEYKRDLSDWEWLCRKCHMTKDGRMHKLQEFNIKRIDRFTINCLNCNREMVLRKSELDKYCSRKCYINYRYYYDK